MDWLFIFLLFLVVGIGPGHVGCKKMGCGPQARRRTRGGAWPGHLVARRPCGSLTPS
jgi:hypothetical protein